MQKLCAVAESDPPVPYPRNWYNRQPTYFSTDASHAFFPALAAYFHGFPVVVTLSPLRSNPFLHLSESPDAPGTAVGLSGVLAPKPAGAEGENGELFRLNPAAGSPWQRVESESGPYYYNLFTQVRCFLEKNFRLAHGMPTPRTMDLFGG